MKKIKVFFPNLDDVEKIISLQELRERLLKSHLSSAVGIGTALYFIALVPIITKHLPVLYPIVYTIIFLWLLAITYIKVLSTYAIRALSLLAFLYILGVLNLFLGGLRAGASLFFITFISLYTLLDGMKGGVIALASTSITLILAGSLTSLGYITPSWYYPASDVMPWLISSLTMILMGILLTISISTLIRSLNEQLKKAIKSANDLEKTYDATIEGWSRALDLRDKDTDHHTKRVTEITLSFARQLGIKEEELINIRRGVLLHDIGKMGIPDAILLKPGSLTEEEMTLIRKHPQLAFDMLSPIEYLKPALDIPLYHHEKWDGTGYPFGLRGEEIPRNARIFAVVDVWDALTSVRPYHAAWEKAKVLEYIKDNAGIHFDPEISQAFMNTIQTENL